MLKLGTEVNNIPQSVLIAKEEVLIMHDTRAVYGEFSDIHEASYRGNRVAIKILRSQVITKVCALLVDIYPI